MDWSICSMSTFIDGENIHSKENMCILIALNTEVKDGEPSGEFQEDLHTQFLYEGEKN